MTAISARGLTLNTKLFEEGAMGIKQEVDTATSGMAVDHADELAELRAQLEQRRLERNSLVEYMNEQTETITRQIAAANELRAENERLKADSTDRDAAWQEKLAEIVGNARKQVERLTARAESAERELAEAADLNNEMKSLLDTACDERDALAEQLRVLREALTDAWDRMDRARRILHRPQEAEWGMLDTKLDRAALATKGADDGQ